MPPFDFPGSPNPGDIFTDPTSGASWTWNGYSWLGGAANTLGALIVSPTPPSAPADNSLWWESDTGMLFLRYNDGNSSQWVQVNALPDGAGYATIPYVNSQAYGMNRLINGDMQFDQRNGGVSSAVIGYTADRWQYAATQAAKMSYVRTSGPGAVANGTPFFLQFTTTTTYGSAAGDAFYLMQLVEANTVNDLAWGTAGAQPVTLSFWISVSIPTVYSGSIRSYPAPSTRSYPFTFNVPNALTWTKITVTIPGDTAGTWVNTGTAAAFAVAFDFGSGSNFRSATAGAWQAGNYLGVNGTCAPVMGAGATFAITGVKLETGLFATPFQFESLQKRLADCQRYFQAGAQLWGGGYGAAGAVQGSVMLFPVPMRIVPATTIGAPTYNNCSALTFAAVTPNSAAPYVTITATGGFTWSTAISAFTLNAEL